MALRLLMRLLHWDPASRPSARQVGDEWTGDGAVPILNSSKEKGWGF